MLPRGIEGVRSIPQFFALLSNRVAIGLGLKSLSSTAAEKEKREEICIELLEINQMRQMGHNLAAFIYIYIKSKQY